eukprot:scaffold11962_cov52-Phaeocystis_antarctica.AAC.1
MRLAGWGGRSFDGLGVLLEVAREAAAHHAEAAVLEVGEALQQLQREDARLVGAVPQLVEGVAQQRHHLGLVHRRLLAPAARALGRRGLLLALRHAAVGLLARALRLVGVHLVLVVPLGLVELGLQREQPVDDRLAHALEGRVARHLARRLAIDGAQLLGARLQLLLEPLHVLHGLHRRVGVGGGGILGGVGRRGLRGAPPLAQRLLLLVVAVVLVRAQVGQVLSRRAPRLLPPRAALALARVLQLALARTHARLVLLVGLVVLVLVLVLLLVAVARGAQPVARRDGRELLDLVVPVGERGLRLREPRVALVHARLARLLDGGGELLALARLHGEDAQQLLARDALGGLLLLLLVVLVLLLLLLLVLLVVALLVVVLEVGEPRAQPLLQRGELGDLALLLGDGQLRAAAVLEHLPQLGRALALRLRHGGVKLGLRHARARVVRGRRRVWPRRRPRARQRDARDRLVGAVVVVRVALLLQQLLLQAGLEGEQLGQLLLLGEQVGQHALHAGAVLVLLLELALVVVVLLVVLLLLIVVLLLLLDGAALCRLDGRAQLQQLALLMHELLQPLLLRARLLPLLLVVVLLEVLLAVVDVLVHLLLLARRPHPL